MPEAARANVAFLTTRWSRVLLAGREDSDSAQEALATLCQDYWYPLYAYCRRQGLEMHDAQDATQGFFNHLLEAGTLQRARAEQGRFRTFLLGSLRHFLANERRHQNAAKRSGGAVVSFDEMAAEQRFASEPADSATPESLFERGWAFALIERVFRRLEDEYLAAEKHALFSALRPLLTAKSARPGHEALAVSLGMSTAAVGTAVFRMRRRYGELMREEIAHLIRVVALKMLAAGELATPEAVQRFRTEASAAARLEHPHIVPVFEVGEHDLRHFFTMRFVPDGRNVAEWAGARLTNVHTHPLVENARVRNSSWATTRSTHSAGWTSIPHARIRS